MSSKIAPARRAAKGRKGRTPTSARNDGTAEQDRADTGLSVVLWPVVKVRPYARNPRKNAGAVAKVAASIREFGFRQPIVVDEKGTIIVGHTRLLAALHLGLREVPVHVAHGLTDAQTKAYRLADNRTAEEAEWDVDLLMQEFADLKFADFDLGLTGFDNGEIDTILGHGNENGNGSEPGPDQWICVITCNSEAELQAIYEEMAGRGLSVRMVT